VSTNYIDNHIDEIRQEFKLLDHWVYLNAADQMIPGNYWLTAARDFYNFVEYGRTECRYCNPPVSAGFLG
jgi:hypothetical protein